MKGVISPAGRGLAVLLEKHSGMIQDVLAEGYDYKKLLRMAVLAAEKAPKLYECSPTSMLAAVTEAARLGLDVGGSTGEAYLIPRKGKVTLSIGYKGLIRLAERGGKVYRERAEVVYEKDEFTLRRDETGDHFTHIPLLDGDRGEVRGAYGVAYFTNGAVQFEWMNLAELEAIHARSEAASDGPWITDPEEMYKKTVIIRLNKDLPLSPDALRASAIANEVRGGKVFELSENGEIITEDTERTARG